MQIAAVLAYLESIAPLSLQEKYDNAGLLTGSGVWECSGALTTLDATEAVVDEAIARKCNLIVAHHPIIFGGLKKITGGNYVERTVISAIKNDIAIYAIHTNLDNIAEGVNGRMAAKLGLLNCRILLPREGILPDGLREVGSGLVGELPETMGEEAFLARLKTVFGLPIVRHTPLTGRPVKTCALCGGAGSSLIPNALASGANFYVTSDVKYHEFFDADGRMVIADIGHYESEQFTIDLLFEVLREKFPSFAVLKSGLITNPVHYY
jgi:dinuclear metal center YbgI/SA1388 family protein